MYLHDPAPELRLVHEITLEGVVAKVLGFARGVSKDWPDRVRAGVPMEMAPLLERMAPGDELWWCTSRVIAPLFGNEGVALVRDGVPIVYLRLWNY